MEKIKQAKATSDQLDSVDDCLDFFLAFEKIDQEVARSIIAQKYAPKDLKNLPYSATG